MTHKILIVDDEQNMRTVLAAMLAKEGYEVVAAADAAEALQLLDDDVSVVVTDLKMPKIDGMALLERVTSDFPSTPVIMITAFGTVSTAVDALKKGAFDFITKPFDRDELKNVIVKAIRTMELNEEEIRFSPDDLDPQGLVGSSAPMLAIYETIRRVAPTTTTVLITGETGTGKELVARAIHKNSPRRNQPFIKINCAAISENLMESELFGHEKGAFTGAAASKQGRFELAHKGTLFLDEVGDIPRDMQVKLLRVLQEQEFERVGGLRSIKVDVRLITATNRNLQQDVKEGRFREDLFYRMNVFPVHLPPLRERTEDIVPLTDFFLQRFNRKLNRQVEGFSPEVRELFLRYEWPGNIRELENLVERMVLMASGPTIEISDIPPEIQSVGSLLSVTPPEKRDKPFKDFLKDHMETLERQMVMKSLEECGGNVTKAARQLGLSRKGLQLKMIKYGLRK